MWQTGCVQHGIGIVGRYGVTEGIVQGSIYLQGTGDRYGGQAFAVSIVVDDGPVTGGKCLVVNPEVRNFPFEGSSLLGTTTEPADENSVLLSGTDLSARPILTLHVVDVNLNVRSGVGVEDVRPAVHDTLGNLNFGIPTPVLRPEPGVIRTTPE